MNILNLRNVANQEINESFSGILRISPNIYEDNQVLLDDPTPLLHVIGSKVDLSDSAGNYLNISFVPRIIPTAVDGIEEARVNLINITQEVSNLYCAKSLHICPTLYIDNKNKYKAPIQIINKNNILLFPIEAPDDDRYLNYNNVLLDEFEDNKDKVNLDNLFDEIWADHPIYNERDEYHVTVNGKKIYRLKQKSSIPRMELDGNTGAFVKKYEESSSMVPELYHHDYVLGQCAGHTYRALPEDLNSENAQNKLSHLPPHIKDSILNDRNAKITELSFIDAEKMIWSLLEGSVNGSYRSFEGRYKGLYPRGIYEYSKGTEDDLYKELFYPNALEINEEEIENTVRANAPLVGLPVQTGLIIYNAMPARRYIFHTLRRYDNISEYVENLKDEKIENYISHSLSTSSSSFMHNLTTEYALCDGKIIKTFKNGIAETEYPAINQISSQWTNWEGLYGKRTPDCVYDAISISMQNIKAGEYEDTIRTPRLFELDQHSLRYLRGLNWQRVATYDKIVSEDNMEEVVPDKWFYEHENMLIERDGTFVLNSIFKDDSVIRPHIKYNKINYEFVNNEFPYNIIEVAENTTDSANIPKDIQDVGSYYANYDYKLAYAHRHTHQLVVDVDLLKNNDTLNVIRDYYKGSKIINDYDESIKAGWSNYVKFDLDTFFGTYVMRTTQELSEPLDKNKLREIQDLPISYRGGTTSPLRKTRSSYKDARSSHGRCTGNYNPLKIFYIGDGGYELTAYRPKDGVKSGWRFISSLPRGINKYGSYKDANDVATVKYGNLEIPIDDSLPNPPAINLLPLMKI